MNGLLWFLLVLPAAPSMIYCGWEEILLFVSSSIVAVVAAAFYCGRRCTIHVRGTYHTHTHTHTTTHTHTHHYRYCLCDRRMMMMICSWLVTLPNLHLHLLRSMLDHSIVSTMSSVFTASFQTQLIPMINRI